MAEHLLKIATVTAAHGIDGEVRIKVFLEDKECFAALAPFTDVEGKVIKCLQIRGQAKGQLIVRLTGSSTREAAEALRGLNLFIPRARLPELEDEDTFYYADLIGLRVKERGETIGIIRSVRNSGAGDVVEIAFPDGTTEYFAFSKANFPSVRVQDGQISFIRPRTAADAEG